VIRSLVAWLVLLVLAPVPFVSSGCGSDDDPVDVVDPGDDDPGPHDGEDSILFRVYVDTPSGGEDLRWVGTPDGPADDSPETTDRPFVPFGRGFRIEWEPDAAVAPVVGTRARVYETDDETFFLPDAGPDSVAFDDTRSIRFANDTPRSAIDPADCGTGPDCFGDLRFPSGPRFLEVRSINANGRVIASGQTLRFDVNYSPTVDLVESPAEPDSTAAFPAWTVALEAGGRWERALAPGDTIPAGAEVRVRLRGQDRFPGATPPDSLCCDVRLDDQGPEVRYKGFTRFTLREDDGFPNTFNTFASEATADSVLVMNVGPADYELNLVSVDEHGRQSDRATLSFVGGFPPRTPRVEPTDGQQIVLRPPDPAEPSDDYQVFTNVGLGFDPVSGRWSETVEELRFDGTLFRIPIRIEADPDSRVPPASSQILGLLTGVPRSFAYTMVSEFDPTNRYAQGIGDREDFYIPATMPRVLELTLTDDDRFEGIEIFVPDLFFSTPGLFDPGLAEPGDPDPFDEWQPVADRIRSDLGRYEFFARASTTVFGSELVQRPPAARGADTRLQDFVVEELERFGRYSPPSETTFSVHLEFQTDAGPVLWPPVSD